MNANLKQNQIKAIFLALIATVCFGIYEYILGIALQDIPVWLCLSYRYVFTGYIYFVFLSTTGENHISFSPRNIDGIIWLRAIFTISYMACLAISFAKAPSQAFVYPFFFLHPLWHEVIHRVLSKEASENIRLQIVFFIIGFSGALLFLYFNLGVSLYKFPSELAKYWQVCAGAFCGGIGFAWTNEISSSIQKKYQSKRYKFSGSDRSEKISSLRINAYTTYAAILLLPVAIPMLKWSLVEAGLEKVNALTFSGSSWSLVLLSIGFTFVAAGSWLMTEAFKCSTSTAKTAAVDYVILPVAFALAFSSSKAEAAPCISKGLLLSIFIIVLGSVIYPITEEVIRQWRMKRMQEKGLSYLIA